jgi:hypothetical protein
MPQDKNDGLKIGELPELSIVPLENVDFHEEPDHERVAELVERFGADGVLQNPPIVAKSNSASRYLLLDGANRITALRTLDFPHVLVQVIDFQEPGLVLSHWHHAVEHLSAVQLLDHAASIDGVTVETEQKFTPTQPRLLCCLTFPEDSKTFLEGAEDLVARMQQLQQFTRFYHRRATMDRVSYTNLDHLRQNYPDFTALVTFAPLTKNDLLTLTAADTRLPSGVTRVVLPKRALRFNLQLDFLGSDMTTEEKNIRLRDTIQRKIGGKCIRFYREPTFFFDE